MKKILLTITLLSSGMLNAMLGGDGKTNTPTNLPQPQHMLPGVPTPKQILSGVSTPKDLPQPQHMLPGVPTPQQHILPGVSTPTMQAHLMPSAVAPDHVLDNSMHSLVNAAYEFSRTHGSQSATEMLHHAAMNYVAHHKHLMGTTVIPMGPGPVMPAHK